MAALQSLTSAACGSDGEYVPYLVFKKPRRAIRLEVMCAGMVAELVGSEAFLLICLLFNIYGF